jgi:hypothetical protein
MAVWGLLLGTPNMAYKTQCVFQGHRYVCLRFTTGNTEHDLEEPARFIRIIDVVVWGLGLGTQNMTYKKQRVLLRPLIWYMI